MQELKERIQKEAKVLPGNIIKVDGFLNHRIDTELMVHIAEEFGKHFNMDEVSVILTAEASGIALSAIVAQYFHPHDWRNDLGTVSTTHPVKL